MCAIQSRQLAAGGGLARAVHANHHDDLGRLHRVVGRLSDGIQNALQLCPQHPLQPRHSRRTKSSLPWGASQTRSPGRLRTPAQRAPAAGWKRARRAARERAHRHASATSMFLPEMSAARRRTPRRQRRQHPASRSPRLRQAPGEFPARQRRPPALRRAVSARGASQALEELLREGLVRAEAQSGAAARP